MRDPGSGVTLASELDVALHFSDALDARLLAGEYCESRPTQESSLSGNFLAACNAVPASITYEWRI
jgi:hypothetical protein